MRGSNVDLYTVLAEITKKPRQRVKLDLFCLMYSLRYGYTQESVLRLVLEYIASCGVKITPEIQEQVVNAAWSKP